VSKVNERLLEIISKHTAALKQLNEEAAAAYPIPGKWSRKEEIGHLIDSAHNNLRRFIVAQYAQAPHVVYAQDDWVAINNYNAQPLQHLVDLWLLLNIQIAHVLSSMTAEELKKNCGIGNRAEEIHSVSWLAEDYLRHLLHHLHHLLNLEAVPY
jgi:hypothetical protein